MRNHLAIYALIAALAPACASDGSDHARTNGPLGSVPVCEGDLGIDRILIVNPTEAALDHRSPSVRAAVEVAIDETRTSCQCATPECLIDWIETNVGCDVCAHIRCGAGTVGACVPCAPAVDDVNLELDGPCLLPPEAELARE